MLNFSLMAEERNRLVGELVLNLMAVGTTYFSKAAEAVDIAGRLKPFPICVAALKSSGGLDKVGCTRVWDEGVGHHKVGYPKCEGP
jgi:hypothetical protein